MPFGNALIYFYPYLSYQERSPPWTLSVNKQTSPSNPPSL
nr:MAG TPA: hypothetical protein [Bacteriophage sp.]